jgi:hypothetical protein
MMTLRVPVTARFPWPGVTPFQAGAVIPLTAPAAFPKDPARTGGVDPCPVGPPPGIVQPPRG